MDLPMRFETKVIHAGVQPDAQTGAVMTPIYQTSTYAQASPGEHRGYEYSRTDNPTRTVLQAQLADLESAEKALVFSSGLASIDAVVNLLKAGDHIVAGDDLYGGTRRLFTKVAANRGIEFSFVDIGNEAALRAEMLPNTKLVWFESPTNPMMIVTDISMVADVARRHGALCAVDNTFMSPYFQRPLELGVDISMHSITKYLNGHSDVVMGALMFNDRPLDDGETLYSRLKFLQNSIGATPGPFDSFLVLRGLKTLAVRMQRHADNAMKIAEYLELHPKVERVLYPGLASHPQYEIAKRQASGFSGMMTFLLRSDLAGTRRFLEAVRLFTLAESLGGVESLIEHPATMTHASVPAEVRKQIGILDNLIRVSVGIEAVDDLLADLDKALAAV
ncbi:trans-sulfuration enzyme family protein [Fimbriimonas ginsengisoli]|uniref:Cystathionine gamma-lyase n=1 Tax=Fimbriimonas ginsengisoli Gsoil 348 TaxID=661478 RepID=A0A068NUG0_FIMGI|nr:PLP-dependent aspartate aminotransferase family protein [Fimbriimonas ginsengisoli]AIE87046.1 Cystathionine gamma-lyase [Fimbriimonas ginsengisoli Gsoil 348]